jgi:hypothetical protein
MHSNVFPTGGVSISGHNWAWVVVVYLVGGESDVANLVTKGHGIDRREWLPVRWMLRQDVLGLYYACTRVGNDKHLYYFSVQ